MEELTILRTVAGCTTILAATIVAADMNARFTVAAFAIFIVASIAWMTEGWFESKSSLVIQNAILLLISVLGVWRWLPWAEKEAGTPDPSEPGPRIRKRLRPDHAGRAGKR